MVKTKKYGFRTAYKQSRHFGECALTEMEDIGSKITKLKEKLCKIITIETLIGKETPGFYEHAEKLIRDSKFSLSDALIVASALQTHSHIIITMDEPLRDKGHLNELRKNFKTLHPYISEIDIKQPVDFSEKQKVKKEYMNWFEKSNKKNRQGDIIDHWKKPNVIGVKCVRNRALRERDNAYLVKFFNGEICISEDFVVESGNLRNYDTNREVRKGKKVTIKLPSDFTYKRRNWLNGMIFLT